MDPQKFDLMQSVSLRRRVQKSVEVDLDRAYKEAKTIKHPWYKCQSLSMVAQFADETKLSTLLQESFNSAMDCHDENRRVSVACWPIEVAIERGRKELAKKFLAQCALQLEKDHHPISRWCAVSVIHVIKFDSELLGLFFEDFRKATSHGHGWKVERAIENLLRDDRVKIDQRYIDYLLQRKAGIERWKSENKANQKSKQT